MMANKKFKKLAKKVRRLELALNEVAQANRFWVRQFNEERDRRLETEWLKDDEAEYLGNEPDGPLADAIGFEMSGPPEFEQRWETPIVYGYGFVSPRAARTRQHDVVRYE